MRYGLIGCGRFGRFCVESLASLAEVRAVAVADEDPEAARALAGDFGLEPCSPAALLAREDIDLVHVATPPWTHHELARQALLASKHVLCEKPLALTLAQADELLALSAGRLLAVNHLLRYNPLTQLVAAVLERRLLGAPLHAFLENYAQDETLPDAHWFWDPARSGGIFVEHGVHFFDLHRWWFGPGEVVGAAACARGQRPGHDRVSCLARHGEVLTQCYHGFDQPQRLDRADHRILCEHGELRLRGWIPEALEVDAACDEAGLEELTALIEPDESETVAVFPEPDCRGRGQRLSIARRVVLRRRLETPKPELYAGMFRDLMADQVRSAQSPAHRPRLSARDARDAVAMACQATELTARDTVARP